jgi:hypothetical protein
MCPEAKLPGTAENCPDCLNLLKRCPQCGVWNRAWANHCRSCQAFLPAETGNWLGYRAGAQRLGVNDVKPPAWESESWDRLGILESGTSLQVGDSCWSLLGYDRHIVAIAKNGAIEIADPAQRATRYRLRAEGPLTCQPCINAGVLYLGASDSLTAYSLGALTLPTPRVTPLWRIPLQGIPIQALTAVDERLYVTVLRNDRKSVHVVENLASSPSSRVLLQPTSRVSWIAGDPRRRQVVFFSGEGRFPSVHAVKRGAHPELTTRSVSSLPPFAEHVPIALLGDKVFGVFGDDERLCRIDAASGVFEKALDADTKFFALIDEGGGAWGGDGVCIDTTGVSFLGADVKDGFAPHDRVMSGSPVILRQCTAIVAMTDGKVRLYDLAHLPRHQVWRVFPEGDQITALASFSNYIAIGNSRGSVKLLELRGKAADA